MTYNAETLRKLEKCLSEAAGPDREIDALIFNSLPNPERVEVAWKESDCTELRRLGCDAQFHDGWLIRKAGEYPAKYANDLPRFTASLDAAVALVERVLPGWWWRIEANGGQAKDKQFYTARVYTVEKIGGDADNLKERYAAAPQIAPALALCLAAIRAIAGNAAE